MESSKSSESEISDSLASEWQVLDGLSKSVEASSQVLSGEAKSAGGLILSFGDSVVVLVSLEESDNASLGLLGLDLSALETD